jgi:hypothetical protein
MKLSFPRAVKPRSLFLSVLVLTFCTFNLTAQNPNGSLRGEIQDASAARIAGARIEVQSTGSSIIREVIANDRGEFRIEGLLPGRYRVVVGAKGFAAATADVDVEVSVVRDITVTLTPGDRPRNGDRAGKRVVDYDRAD